MNTLYTSDFPHMEENEILPISHSAPKYIYIFSSTSVWQILKKINIQTVPPLRVPGCWEILQLFCSFSPREF